jgi:acetate kinase
MIFVVNSGSSSLKFALYTKALEQLAGGVVETTDHAAALNAVLSKHPVADLTAAAHRVVHGGAHMTGPCRITPQVIAQINALCPLAPLHNPPALAAIRALQTLAPNLPQYASFDTAFHATNPDVATRYAIPQALHDQGIRRYGFHGLSYASLTAQVPKVQRLLACHLGNGASLCAILNGQSVATTMGYSPLDGLTMGTRSGGIDGNAVLAIAAQHGVEGAGHILNRQSGLTALGGSHDMRKATRDARQHFAYWAIRHAGSMIAAMGGLDAVAFTGGIGENDHAIRAMILDGLAYMGAVYDAPANRQNASVLHDGASGVAIWTVAAQEERHIGLEALQVMEAV